MTKRFSLLLLLSCFFNQQTVAKDVFMAFSQDIPPYIFQEYDKGIELDIISEALAYKGHSLKPLYFPLGRVPIAFQEKLVDAAMGDMGVNLSEHGGFYGDPAVIYHNVFITLKKNNVQIKQPSDLDKLAIVSFQGAEKRYPNWLTSAHKEGRFFGISDQQTQVKLLHFGRFDVVLSDRYIFKYFVKQLKLKNMIETIDVQEHEFTTIIPEDYRPVFNDQQIRDDFNMGLKHIKESGKFQTIYDNYLE